MSPKERETKPKMTYCNFIGIKSFCTAKETVDITKRQPIEWEKVSANDYQIMDSNPKINKELIKLNTQKNPKSSSQEMGRRHEQIFFQGSDRMAIRHMKKCFTSIIMREIQIKTTVRYHLKPIRMAKINKSGNNRCRC